ncbi:hypothetical protein ACOSQ2_026100 [Xanthoceras sorbifolium]
MKNFTNQCRRSGSRFPVQILENASSCSFQAMSPTINGAPSGTGRIRKCPHARSPVLRRDDKLKEAIEVLKEEGGSNEGTKRKASRRESFEGELGRRGGAGSGRQEGRPPKIDKTEKMVVYGPKNPRGRPSQPKSEVAQPSGG